jgi:hypothetical protein
VFSGRASRAGFVTSALEGSVDAPKIMPITRHLRSDTLKGYDRREKRFRRACRLHKTDMPLQRPDLRC